MFVGLTEVVWYYIALIWVTISLPLVVGIGEMSRRNRIFKVTPIRIMLSLIVGLVPFINIVVGIYLLGMLIIYGGFLLHWLIVDLGNSSWWNRPLNFKFKKEKVTDE